MQNIDIGWHKWSEASLFNLVQHRAEITMRFRFHPPAKRIKIRLQKQNLDVDDSHLNVESHSSDINLTISGERSNYSPVLPGEGVDNLLLGSLLTADLETLVFTDSHPSGNSKMIRYGTVSHNDTINIITLFRLNTLKKRQARQCGPACSGRKCEADKFWHW